MVQLLLVDPVAGPHPELAPTLLPGADATLDAVGHAVRRFGAEVTALRNGMLLVTLPPRGSARDRAEAMGLVALKVREALPDARVALASGRSDTARGSPLGPAVDRCAALLGAATPGEVTVDDTSARLLEERFVMPFASP